MIILFRHFPLIQSNWSLHLHTPSSFSSFPFVKHVFAFSVPVHCSFSLHFLCISFLATRHFETHCIITHSAGKQIQILRDVINMETFYDNTIPLRHFRYSLSSTYSELHIHSFLLRIFLQTSTYSFDVPLHCSSISHSS